MTQELQYWTGKTLLAAPGWRAAVVEEFLGAELRRIVPVESWGIQQLGGELVPLDADSTRLDVPGLLMVAGPETSDQDLWAALWRGWQSGAAA